MLLLTGLAVTLAALSNTVFAAPTPEETDVSVNMIPVTIYGYSGTRCDGGRWSHHFPANVPECVNVPDSTRSIWLGEPGSIAAYVNVLCPDSQPLRHFNDADLTQEKLVAAALESILNRTVRAPLSYLSMNFVSNAGCDLSGLHADEPIQAPLRSQGAHGLLGFSVTSCIIPYVGDSVAA